MENLLQALEREASCKQTGLRACLALRLKNHSTLALNSDTVCVYLRTVLISGIEITTFNCVHDLGWFFTTIEVAWRSSYPVTNENYDWVKNHLPLFSPQTTFPQAAQDLFQFSAHHPQQVMVLVVLLWGNLSVFSKAFLPFPSTVLAQKFCCQHLYDVGIKAANVVRKRKYGAWESLVCPKVKPVLMQG